MRMVSIVIGASLATFLILVALVVPDAVYPPDPGMEAVWRANVIGALLFALIPAVVLLITTSRISSATRDRRLASLRLIGMDRGRAALVAAGEAGSLTAVGALIGAVTVWGLAALVGDAVATGQGWFAEPLQPSVAMIVTVAVGVVVVGAAISATPLLRRSNILQQRSASARRRPSLWRLAVPAAGAALLLNIVLAGEQTLTWSSARAEGTLAGGALLVGVGIAVATPVLADVGAAGLVRIRRVPAVLAARGLQLEPLATTRLVAGLAVALYLAIGGSAVLLAFESTPFHRSALQALGEGPQQVLVVDADNGGPNQRVAIDPDQLRDVDAALTALPGVLMVAPDYKFELADCTGGGPSCFPSFFVGTCEELATVMAVTGCSDEHPGFISAVNPSPEFPIPMRLPGEPDVTVMIAGGGELTLHLGPDLVQDAAATAERWVYPNPATVFVPDKLVEGTGAEAQYLVVVATGGNVMLDHIAAALPAGTELAADYAASRAFALADVARIRLVIYALTAIALGTAILGLVLTSIDHARERRHVVARQQAIGMPARVLYAGQLLQSLLPLVAALALATALGWLSVEAWAAVSRLPSMTNARTLWLVGTTTVVGAALVALVTIPATRTRLTATLLRRE